MSQVQVIENLDDEILYSSIAFVALDKKWWLNVIDVILLVDLLIVITTEYGHLLPVTQPGYSEVLIEQVPALEP